jgi:type I restriction enzyme R subunit
MIATGTDVKPIECVFFMRMVRSRQYFEQMKGRGVRVIDPTDLQGVTPDAKVKDRFVIVDAIGVTEADLHDTVPLERKPNVSFEKLLHNLALGNREPELISSIVSRIARLNLRLSKGDREELEATAGLSLTALADGIVDAMDPDRQYDVTRETTGIADPGPEDVHAVAQRMIEEAVRPLADSPEFRSKLAELRRSYDQVIDETSADVVTVAGYSVDATDRARRTVESFHTYIEEHKDQIEALQILYSRPYKQRLTFKEIKELANAIGRPPHSWTPERLWAAYETLDRSKVRSSGPRVLTDIVQLVRFALRQEDELVPFPERVNERFSGWLLQQQQARRPFTAEQMEWLERIRDHIAASLAITTDDFQYTPFSQHGGLGKAFEVFGNQLDPLLIELNEALAA